MPQLDTPLQLSPVFKPKIWGRQSLAPLYERPDEQTALSFGIKESDLIGEVWITDDNSRFLNGPPAGLTLKDATEEYGPELCGHGWRERQFPILAKYIYTSDWLSVQVHPDDEYARVHDPGSPGKCEMWYVVDRDTGGEFLLGLKSGATKEKLKAALEKGDSREILRSFRARLHEAIFVPPGTVHALGPGLVLFEAEENSDLTYRLDDFGRVGLDGKPRPLHWDKGLDVTRPEASALRDLPRVRFREVYGSRRFVIACRYFAVEELTITKKSVWTGSRERVEVLSVVGGAGRVETDLGWLGYRTGDTWLIPPAARPYRLVPGQATRILKTYVPDLNKDFRRALAGRKVGKRTIEKICYD